MANEDATSRQVTMPFEFKQMRLPDVIRIRPRSFEDARGFFMETYKSSEFAAHGIPEFVQDNTSRSTRGVLRGLHFQADPHAQGKLVRVSYGAIFDVAVDLRYGSVTLGQWVGLKISAENREMLYVPEGFAHGFLVLSESADVQYKATREYSAAADRALVWNDPEVGIEWPDIGIQPILSEKDAAAPLIADADLFDWGMS
jgi:dTDP-4-dehydrorhamnose 3,5-epimerase